MAGALYWHQHLGRSDGTDTWTSAPHGVKIDHSIPWNDYRQVFAADDRVLYGVDENGCLYWHQHWGRSDGTEKWAEPVLGARRLHVGINIPWSDYKHVFGADDGVIYGVDDTGCLYWHQHLGRSDGTENWTKDPNGVPRVQVGKKLRRREPDPQGHESVVHNDWKYRQVFAANDSIIYAVKENGQLFWYRHLGRSDGTENWKERLPGVQCILVGAAWNYEHAFAADDAVVYGVNDSDTGNLYWYRHVGRSDGTEDWEQPAPGVYRRQIGVGNVWKYKHVFAADDGVIYAVP